MAGYWPSSFFACLWTETKSRSINSQKKRTRPISSHLDRTNLVNKGLIIWVLGKFCLRGIAGSPERARWLHLSRSGSQSQRAIWFILPARGASHIIRNYYRLVTWWYNIHLMYGPDGNSQFCFPESPDVSREEVEGNIRLEGKQN